MTQLASSPRHVPVLLKEVLDLAAPQPGDAFIDATFGAGGYSNALLRVSACRVIAIDRDPAAIQAGQALQDAWQGRLELVQGRFSEMLAICAARNVSSVNGIVMDIGASSMQLDQSERGFSFQNDGPLDMRMEQTGPTAADLVNGASEEELADIFYLYGEERHARKIARAIVADRIESPFVATAQLAGLIRRLLPRKPGGIDPATRSFQALRIAVNQELKELEEALLAAETLLADGGRLLVVTFHSLEDRIVKTFLKTRSGALAASPSRHLPPLSQAASEPAFKLLTAKPVIATPEEAQTNPRARSAKLRAALRTRTNAHSPSPSAQGEPI